MAEQQPNEKAEEEKADIVKSPEYKRFKALLRKVVKAPPLRRAKVDVPVRPQTTAED